MNGITRNSPHSSSQCAALLGVLLGAIPLLLSGCAGKTVAQKRNTGLSAEALAAEEEARLPATRGQIEDFKILVSKLTSRIETLESKLTQVSDKVDLTRAAVESNHSAPLQKTVAVQPSSVDRAGVVLGDASQGKIDQSSALARSGSKSGTSTAGFVQDAATSSYRKGMILFDAKKFPEAVLAFSEFLEQFPDHVLAGSAQFRIGESYYQQRELKLALAEYQRVMTSFDRSPHGADSLARIIEIADTLKMPELSEKSRQTLKALFAGSPANERLLTPFNSSRNLQVHGNGQGSGMEELATQANPSGAQAMLSTSSEAKNNASNPQTPPTAPDQSTAPLAPSPTHEDSKTHP